MTDEDVTKIVDTIARLRGVAADVPDEAIAEHRNITLDPKIIMACGLDVGYVKGMVHGLLYAGKAIRQTNGAMGPAELKEISNLAGLLASVVLWNGEDFR